MNILYLTPAYYPAFKFGGPIESDYQLNVALVKKGINIDVMTTNCGLEDNKDIKTNQWINTNGIRVKYFPYFTNESYTFSPKFFLTVLREIRNYDLIHISAFWNFQALAGSLVSIISKKPYLISPRGVLYEEAINSESKQLKKLYFSLVARHCLSHAKAIHFTTEDERENVADFIKTYVNNKALVVPNGIDLSRYNKLPEKGLFKAKYPVLADKRFILFLSRINKQKGLEILVEAFKKLADIDDKIFLVIAGPDNDDYTRHVKKILMHNGLFEKTLFTGMLVGEDKYSALVDSEVFVLPSYFENFAMSVVEAMACGVPVVISNKVGIYREVEKFKAGIVVKNDPIDIFQGIRMILNDANLRQQMVFNGKRLVSEHYNIDNVASRMINAYSKLVL